MLGDAEGANHIQDTFAADQMQKEERKGMFWVPSGSPKSVRGTLRIRNSLQVCIFECRLCRRVGEPWIRKRSVQHTHSSLGHASIPGRCEKGEEERGQYSLVPEVPLARAIGGKSTKKRYVFFSIHATPAII